MESNYWTRMRARRISRRTMLGASAKAGVGAAGLALVGCGDDDDDDDAATAAVEEQAEAQAEQQAAQVEQAEEQAQAQAEVEEEQAEEQAVAAVSGGVYRRPNTSTPNFVRMGFGSAGNNTGFNQDFSIYERLARVSNTTWEADPATGPTLSRVSDLDFTVEPVLATGWERPDDTTWVFGIRTDPVWHTGRSFDSEDIHYMFESIRDENVAGGGSPAFLMSANLDVGEPVDASTYRLTLTKPTGYIETLLEQTNIVDRETYDERIDDAVIVGTGPYTFENYDPNRGWDQLPHADFAANNNHPFYSGGTPQFDKIQHTLFADSAAMALAFEAGELDSHQGLGIGLPEVEKRLLDGGEFNAWTGHGAGGRVVRFRADAEPFRNKLARQAVLMLIDGPRVQQEFAGLFDNAARMPWQPGSVAYKEGGGAALDPHPMGVDPDAARAEAGALFEAAGFSGGEVLKLDILPERLDAPATAQLIQQEVAAFGIETEINPREYTEMITLQTTGTFEHMIIGFGNWIKPGSPAVTVLFADAYDGRMNAPADENVAIADRPGISDEPEWLDMIQQAIDGTWTDWQAWNEKYLDVAWSNAIFRQYGVGFTNKNIDNSARDANSYPYAVGTRFVT